MGAKRRIALYGGTFDPVHLGHLEVARRVAALFELERVLFVPAQIAPHKTGLTVTPAIHRYAMLALATQNDEQLFVSTFELEAPNRRYTVDTVSHFLNEFSDDSEMFFIMGADSWTEITTWREWERLLGMINHVVVTRPGYDIDEAEVGPNVRKRIVDMRGKGRAPGDTGRHPRIYFTDAVSRDIAATDIRNTAREGRIGELTDYVSSAVATYIVKYRIYQ